MAITTEQFKAANGQAAATLARGSVARAARFDARRGRIVIELQGGCEFAFPVTLAEGLPGAPRAKLSKMKWSLRGGPLRRGLIDVLHSAHILVRRQVSE